MADQLSLLDDGATLLRKHAILSPCGTYRYSLTRAWPGGDGKILWIMLNPSTADASIDDPTIRRCIDFSQRWGFSSLEVVNLFAYRSTDPKALERAHAQGVDITGPDNDKHMFAAALGVRKIVAAWGNHGSLLGRGNVVLRWLERAEVWMFKRTAQGQPEHPLYQRKDAVLVPATP